eukprot:1156184-Pelagomonas_calceolata.AAC.20
MPLTQGCSASGEGASGTSAAVVAAQAALPHVQPTPALRQQLLSLLVQVLADDLGRGAPGESAGARAAGGAATHTLGYAKDGSLVDAHGGAPNKAALVAANQDARGQDGTEGGADWLSSEVNAALLTEETASKGGAEPGLGATGCGNAEGKAGTSMAGQGVGSYEETPEDDESSDDFDHAAIFECAAEQEWELDTFEPVGMCPPPTVESRPLGSEERGSKHSTSHKADPASHVELNESKQAGQNASKHTASPEADPVAHARSHASEQGAQYTSEPVQSKQTTPQSRTRTPNHRRHPARRPVKRFVLVVEEEAAMDEGLMELLQQLVCYPATVASLATDEYARGLACTMDREVGGVACIVHSFLCAYKA